jgi:hypothetical protein
MFAEKLGIKIGGFDSNYCDFDRKTAMTFFKEKRRFFSPKMVIITWTRPLVQQFQVHNNAPKYKKTTFCAIYDSKARSLPFYPMHP